MFRGAVSRMRVGLLGGGTVGGGVCEIIRQRQTALLARGANFEIVRMCVRDTGKKRDFAVPEGCQITSDPRVVLEDPSIDMVVELMGGVTVAKDAVFSALSQGKHVVTANKALVAAHLPEIQAAIKQQQGVAFGYEAAVCGGIPIINALQHDYVGDTVSRVMGIMNGTTNFILSKMDAEGAAYDSTLAEAQRLGYAETPPDFDVEGWDARSKLAIMCKLAFGVFVPESSIPCAGIAKVTADDFAYAKHLGCTVKNLGIAERNADGSVSAYVSTCLVPLTNQLSRVNGVTNCVEVSSQNLGSTHFSGPGAGRYATANSVMNDMVMIAQGGGRGDPFCQDCDVVIRPEVEGVFYLKFMIKDGVGIVRKIGECAEKAGISLNSLLQAPVIDADRVSFCVTTDRTTLSSLRELCKGVEAESWCLEPAVVMPVVTGGGEDRWIGR